MIVVDTNAIVYLMVEGEKTEIAQLTYQQDSSWAVPPLWRHEFLNVLATLVRHDGITLGDAIDIWQKSTRLFAPGECDVDMNRALRVASQHKVSAYDAQYVALAMELGVAYVTEDQQLLKTFPDLTLPMREFCES